MKKTYEAPEFDIVLINDEDVITTSDDNEGETDWFGRSKF